MNAPWMNAAVNVPAAVAKTVADLLDGVPMQAVATRAVASTGAGMIAAQAFDKFMLAGRAKFTAVSRKTSSRYTYRVTRGRRDGVHLVHVLTGPANAADYTYVGILVGAQFRPADESPAAKGFAWLVARLVALRYAEIDAGLELWHAGECGRCGRLLTVPASIASGLGPECAKK